MTQVRHTHPANAIDAGEVNEMTYVIFPDSGQMVGEFHVIHETAGAPVRYETLALINPDEGVFEARVDLNQSGWVLDLLFDEANAAGYDNVSAIDAVLPAHLIATWVSEPIQDDPEFDTKYVLVAGITRMDDETRAKQINRRLEIG